eukprot:SAG11_NODE_429_length_9534_cov_14.689242_8_plen_151_part_00
MAFRHPHGWKLSLLFLRAAQALSVETEDDKYARLYSRRLEPRDGTVCSVPAAACISIAWFKILVLAKCVKFFSPEPDKIDNTHSLNVLLSGSAFPVMCCLQTHVHDELEAQLEIEKEISKKHTVRGRGGGGLASAFRRHFHRHCITGQLY